MVSKVRFWVLQGQAEHVKGQADRQRMSNVKVWVLQGQKEDVKGNADRQRMSNVRVWVLQGQTEDVKGNADTERMSNVRIWVLQGQTEDVKGKLVSLRVNFLCWLLFRYSFHPCVTAVARKRSLPLCQKCRWQVKAIKHTCAMYVASSKTVNWCMVIFGPVSKSCKLVKVFSIWIFNKQIIYQVKVDPPTLKLPQLLQTNFH